MCALTDEPQRAKQHFDTRRGSKPSKGKPLQTLIDMKKLERIALTFCYVFTLVAVLRMCVSLLQNFTFVTLASVLSLGGLFVGLGFLFFMAAVMLFTKRE